MAVYRQSSAYRLTGVNRNALDILVYRNITKQPDDIAFTINSIYALRPDKLAYDLYNDSNLWWVFAVRNPAVIEDPIFDFQAGRTIYIPKLATLQQDLGISS